MQQNNPNEFSNEAHLSEWKSQRALVCDLHQQQPLASQCLSTPTRVEHPNTPSASNGFQCLFTLTGVEHPNTPVVIQVYNNASMHPRSRCLTVFVHWCRASGAAMESEIHAGAHLPQKLIGNACSAPLAPRHRLVCVCIQKITAQLFHPGSPNQKQNHRLHKFVTKLI